jgi:hypothetical protein
MDHRSPPQTTPSDDPVLDVEVEHAIEPYRALLPPEMLELLRATIAQAYLEHPTGQRILHNLREETRMVNESGEVPIEQENDAGTRRPMVSSGIRRKRAR